MGLCQNREPSKWAVFFCFLVKPPTRRTLDGKSALASEALRPAADESAAGQQPALGGRRLSAEQLGHWKLSSFSEPLGLRTPVRLISHTKWLWVKTNGTTHFRTYFSGGTGL